MKNEECNATLSKREFATAANGQVKLSEHFTLAEMTKTSVKTLDGNMPTAEHTENLRRLCRWLEMLRARYNMMYGGGVGERPLIINSAYRSPLVNRLVGGVAASNHLTGCAADIRVTGEEQLLRYANILLDISDEAREDFDELLLERSRAGTYWLHFAVRPDGNRRKIRLIQT